MKFVWDEQKNSANFRNHGVWFEDASETQNMKKEYDFTNAEQGRFYRPLSQLDVPVRLDKDVRNIILKTARGEQRGQNEIVNELLRERLAIAL